MVPLVDHGEAAVHVVDLVVPMVEEVDHTVIVVHMATMVHLDIMVHSVLMVLSVTMAHLVVLHMAHLHITVQVVAVTKSTDADL